VEKFLKVRKINDNFSWVIFSVKNVFDKTIKNVLFLGFFFSRIVRWRRERRTVRCDLCNGRARRDVAGTGQDTEVLWSPWLSGFPVLYSRGDYLTVCNARARDSDALLLPAINTRRMCVPATAPPANLPTRE